jgi:hypothetical protein
MEKSNRRKREKTKTQQEERRTLAEKTGFLSSLSLQLFSLFSGGVSLLSSKTDSFPQRKKPPLSLLQTCPQIIPQRQKTKKNTHKSQKRPRDLKCNKMQHLSLPFFHRSTKKKPLRKLPVHTNISIFLTIHSTQNHITIRTTTTTIIATTKAQGGKKKHIPVFCVFSTRTAD